MQNAQKQKEIFKLIKKDRWDEAEKLIKEGVDINAKSKKSLLIRVVLKNNIEAIKFLLEHGADPNIKQDLYSVL